MKKTLIIISLTIFLFTACSTQSPTATKTISINPCNLITQENIKEIFPSTELKNTKNQTEANSVGQKICFYEAENDMKFIQISTIEESQMANKGYPIKDAFLSTKKIIENIQEVTNLGDSAYYGGNGLKIGAGLHTLIEDKGLIIEINIGLGTNNDDDKRHLALEKSLMQKIIQNL